MKVFYPPYSTNESLKQKFRIFLAGSIEMGTADNWQEKFIKNLDSEISKEHSEEICIFNPRRADWDNTWIQSIENPYFSQQVNWELENLERATHIIMYFQPGTQSPISLLELGLHAKSGKLIVISPTGFWRKGNIDILCNKLGIIQEENLESAIEYIKELKYEPAF
jgi:hypothetical protein